MPIFNKKDKLGTYFIWGTHGSRYYFNDLSNRSKKIAYNKALKQGKAIHANK
jgi:hypothetical protein